MNNKEKIILYLDNQLDPGEKEEFEHHLRTSPELMNELEHFRKVLGSVKQLNVRSLDQTYFAGSIPRLREKLQKQKKLHFRKQLIFASSAAVIALVILSLFLFRNIGKTSPEGGNLALTEDEISSFANSLSSQELYNALDNGTESTWNDLLSYELNFSYETADSILKSFNGNVNYTEGLDEQEASLIYDRLINKEFF